MPEIDWDEPLEYVMMNGTVREAKFVGHLNDRYIVGVRNGDWYVVNVQANGYWGGETGSHIRNVPPKPHVEETTVYLYRTPTTGVWYTSLTKGSKALGTVKVKITEGEYK